MGQFEFEFEFEFETVHSSIRQLSDPFALCINNSIRPHREILLCIMNAN